MDQYFRLSRAACLLVVASLLLFGGCGGGTDGSGVRSLNAVLVSSTGAGIPNVLVTDNTTGATTVTGAAGEFRLDTNAEGDSLLLTFEGAGLSAQSQISNLPAGDVVISARFEANILTNAVEATQVQVTAPTQSPAVTPTATPIPPATPTAVPAATPANTPTPTPSPQPSSTPTPTPTVFGSAEACRYDLDGNGVVTLTDIDTAELLFSQGQLGDFNNDGFANSSDLSSFLSGVIPLLNQSCVP